MAKTYLIVASDQLPKDGCRFEFIRLADYDIYVYDLLDHSEAGIITKIEHLGYVKMHQHDQELADFMTFNGCIQRYISSMHARESYTQTEVSHGTVDLSADEHKSLLLRRLPINQR
jgi:hypothetical protein